VTEIVHKPGVTIIDGVEHPDAVWRCACGAGLLFRPFTLPPGWCTLTIEIGGENGISKREVRNLCPACAQGYLSGAGRGTVQPTQLKILPPRSSAPPSWPPWKR